MEEKFALPSVCQFADPGNQPRRMYDSLGISPEGAVDSSPPLQWRDG